ncbi:phasin family protein [Marinobacterium arenosum]|uniref:phasin family protein n=1 Tax=Marinobacterium arenosum TaxID=2862496 RepID=UPI001C980244|nr:phasin family protein [Marinobacterium arenosum]MBY4677845.1 phasin family protein [Marinobacterium arenosum]
MYQDMMKDMKDQMKPVVDMADINKKTAEKLFALQSEYVSDFVNSSLEQVRALTEARDPKQVVELQVNYFKQLESKMTEVAEKELAAMTEAKDQFTNIFESSFADMGEMPYFKQFADMGEMPYFKQFSEMGEMPYFKQFADMMQPQNSNAAEEKEVKKAPAKRKTAVTSSVSAATSTAAAS